MTVLSFTLDGSISHGFRSANIRSIDGRSVSCKYRKPTNRIASSISFDTSVFPRNIVFASLQTQKPINLLKTYQFYKNKPAIVYCTYVTLEISHTANDRIIATN